MDVLLTFCSPESSLQKPQSNLMSKHKHQWQEGMKMKQCTWCSSNSSMTEATRNHCLTCWLTHKLLGKCCDQGFSTSNITDVCLNTSTPVSEWGVDGYIPLQCILHRLIPKASLLVQHILKQADNKSEASTCNVVISPAWACWVTSFANCMMWSSNTSQWEAAIW